MKELQKLVYEEYKKNGYEKQWSEFPNDGIADIAELGLVDTEISEAIECIRKRRPKDELAFELADAVIRIMTFATRKGIDDLGYYIQAKHEKNMERGYLHGRKV